MPPDPAQFPLGAALTTETLDRDPYPALAQLRAGEPVSWVPALEGWLVTRYDLAVAVMRDPVTFTVQDARFSTARLVGPSMLSLDGSEHDRHRGAFAPPFRPAAVRDQFAIATQAETDGLLDELAPRGEADLRARFAGPLAARVLTRALGLPGGEADGVRAYYEAIVAAVDAITAGQPPAPAGLAAHRDLAHRLLDASERAPHASLLRAAAAHGDLTPTELVANAIVLLFGGIDTTEGMIANALTLLLAQTEARDEVTLDRVIDESLRLEPAAAMVDRYATTDTELAGARIAAGDLVHVSLTAAGRDAAVFPDPDRPRLSTPHPRGHLAFAQGPHVCLGVHLARLETRIALRTAVARLPNLRLATDRPPPIRGLVFRKPVALHARWDAAAATG